MSTDGGLIPYPMPDPVTEDEHGNIVPVRDIIPVRLKRRPPEEARARLLSPDSPLPRELAETLADEVAPEG
jgi:hypothetical protein